jgi:tetratricopeptide (TPR) repeat protein
MSLGVVRRFDLYIYFRQVSPMLNETQDRLDQVAQALDRQDYRTATQLLKGLWQEMPENPWVQIYRARLYEAANKADQAEQVYRQLLKDVTNPKIALAARQGLQRLQDSVVAARQQEIAVAAAAPGREEPGILVLESIEPETRQAAAMHLAKIFQLEPYAARMLMPNRGWRLYRMGTLGELDLYQSQMAEAKIPAFSVATERLQTVPVYQVKYLQDFEPQVVVVCADGEKQAGEVKFAWSEVTQMVEGALPMLERVVDTDARDGAARVRKESTQDYARVCDLHLPGRSLVLRFYDRSYNFHEGVAFADEGSLDAANTRIQWNALMVFLKQHLNVPVWSEFMPFAEIAMDFPHLLETIKPQIDLFGQEGNVWASAFELYSGLGYWRER